MVRHIPVARGEILSRVQYRTAVRVRRIGDRLRTELARRQGRTPVDVYGSKIRGWILMGSDASAGAAAGLLWNDLVDELRAHGDVLPPPVLPLRGDFVMPLWLRGPGALFWRRLAASARWRNRELGQWVSDRWLDQVLLDLYTMLARITEAARPIHALAPGRPEGSAARYRRELDEHALWEKRSGEGRARPAHGDGRSPRRR